MSAKAIAELDPNNIDYLAHGDPWATSQFSSLSIIPSAHAWGWVDTLDLFIPISSINDVIDQIDKIGTEEFNPVILIISDLDIALLFSGPLKPALSVVFKPLKKLAANKATLKVMKILWPFFGNVIKKVGDSKSIAPILNLLPFFMILGEIAADEEARQAIPIIVDAISSSEDLEVWFEYFRLPTEGWVGNEIPGLELDLAANDSIQGLPLSGLMN